MNKDTTQSKSEKEAVKALIEAGLHIKSPQKSSTPNLDSWVIQNLPENSKNPCETKKTLKVLKRRTILAPPVPNPTARPARTSSSLCKSSREAHIFPISLVPLAYNNYSKEPVYNRLKTSVKPKTRSGSLADSRLKDRLMEASDIRKALYSVFLKNYSLCKLKPEDFNRLKVSTDNFQGRFGKNLKKNYD